MTRIQPASDKADVRPTAGLGRRIFRARLEASIVGPKKISQAELGLLVGRHLGAAKGITGATVSRWEAEESVPDLATVGAIAVVCQVDPGWLAYGNLSKAPAPWAQDDPRRRMVRERRIVDEQHWLMMQELLDKAVQEHRERDAKLHARLWAVLDSDAPESRQLSREIIAEMDAPGPLDRFQRMRMTEQEIEEADEREREREREQRRDWLQQDLDDGLITQEQFDELEE